MEKALKQAKSLAKTLLKQVKAGDKEALLRFKKHYRNEKLCAEAIKLAQCQHCIALQAKLGSMIGNSYSAYSAVYQTD